jgi:para-aminobenzoate synthetase component 1
MHARVESYATVHHLVSIVRGELSVEATLADILRATFPGGSITGAPKIRAMQILAEVEPRARGIYTGAIGSFNGARSLELNVAIRTAIAGSGRIHYCTGGGIVADSVMAAEWEETRIKARAFLDAVFPRAERASATL